MYTVEMCQNLTMAHIQESTIVLAKAKTFRELHDKLRPYLFRSEAGQGILNILKDEPERIPQPREGIGYSLETKREVLFGTSMTDLALIVCYVAD